MTEDENGNYIIIDEDYRDECEEKVNEYIKRGYVPLGGVSTYVDDDDRVHYCQALLKK